MATEIRDGCDELHHTLRSIMDRNFDKFELYALKNVTKVPEALAKQLEAAQAPLPLPSYSEFTATEDEEQRLRARVESLQTQILQVCTAFCRESLLEQHADQLVRR